MFFLCTLLSMFLLFGSSCHFDYCSTAVQLYCLLSANQKSRLGPKECVGCKRVVGKSHQQQFIINCDAVAKRKRWFSQHKWIDVYRDLSTTVGQAIKCLAVEEYEAVNTFTTDKRRWAPNAWIFSFHLRYSFRMKWNSSRMLELN